jgi:hypothetical protein
MGRTCSGSSSRARAPVTRSQPVGHRPLTGTQPIAGRTLARDAHGRDPRDGRAAGSVRGAPRRPTHGDRRCAPGHARRPRRIAPPRARCTLGGVASLAGGDRGPAAVAAGRAHRQRGRVRRRLARGARHDAGADRPAAAPGPARRASSCAAGCCASGSPCRSSTSARRPRRWPWPSRCSARSGSCRSARLRRPERCWWSAAAPARSPPGSC